MSNGNGEFRIDRFRAYAHIGLGNSAIKAHLDLNHGEGDFITSLIRVLERGVWNPGSRTIRTNGHRATVPPVGYLVSEDDGF